MQYTSQNARFSKCKTYRYSLSRAWSEDMESGRVVFIGLNPSKADHRSDDPTIRRCAAFAKSWGYGSMEDVNLFAFCATRPKDLRLSPHPIGRSNDRCIATAIASASLSIACWGNHGVLLGRAEQILRRYPKLLCLGKNTGGQLKHPLYIKSTQRPFAIAP